MNDIIKNPKFKVYNPPRVGWVPYMIKKLLDASGVDAEIITNILENDDSLYILPCHQTLQKFPKYYVVYQLEQVGRSKYFTKEYCDVIENAIAVMDYSELNIKNYAGLIKYQKNILYQPIPMSSELEIFENKSNHNYEYDILFYGTMNYRRLMILAYVKKVLGAYKIKIIDNLFGDELLEHIKKSKIVLNIHYYKSAVLETTRLNEVLQFDNIVISEMADKNDDNYAYYNNNVVFVKEITNVNMKSMAELICAISNSILKFDKRDIDNRNKFLKEMSDISSQAFKKNLKIITHLYDSAQSSSEVQQ